MSMNIGAGLEQSLQQERVPFTPVVTVPLERVTLWADVWENTPDLEPGAVGVYLSLAVGVSARPKRSATLVRNEEWGLVLVDEEGREVPTTTRYDGCSGYLYSRIARLPRAQLAGLRVAALSYQPPAAPKKGRRR